MCTAFVISWSLYLYLELGEQSPGLDVIHNGIYFWYNDIYYIQWHFSGLCIHWERRGVNITTLPQDVNAGHTPLYT